MRPSDTWQSPAELGDVRFSASKVWPTLPLDAIERLAAATRSPPVHCVANRNKYSSGQYNVAIELAFDDDVVWIARLWTNHDEESLLSAEETSRRLSCEVATLKLVKERTTIPVPTVFAYSVTDKNPLGWPYVFMSPLPGRSAEDLGISSPDDDFAIPPEKAEVFKTYCASMAAIQLQLSEISFDRIGSVYLGDHQDSFVIGPDVKTGIMPCASEGAYYAALCDKLIKDVLTDVDEEVQDDALFGVWIYSLLTATISRSRDMSGSYKLCHRDLHGKNTLLDPDGKIVGVLDWDFAACMPIEIFAGDACNLMKDMHWDNADQLEQFELYNRALRHAEEVRDSRRPNDPTSTLSGHMFSDLHASTTVQLVGYMSNLIPEYAGCRWVWEILCRHLFGTRDWAPFRQSPIFAEWCATQHVRLATRRVEETISVPVPRSRYGDV
ncbi:hypothetical protein EXIGLDRAFT_731692 [Exidia glandulosa HHB12029]|uniref:Aminoglycoside phosphotransferase domain-containing protein n=1 Tax=Exidia glandulosa HHB12029 TaxID=1314781 RepID=A0A165ZB98_EXIGL|nr:hypothetical protein EXIGLDRAFT_731692 [Exidia glandulosa HHB12029]